MSIDKVSSTIVHRQVAGVDEGQKVLNHVKFVPQQSTDKIGDLSIDNRGFCLQVCTKPKELLFEPFFHKIGIFCSIQP